ncbi:hypothetical protein SD77_1814 [Bacillus badius]|uniref:Ribose 5-phosphate isomerase B n=1 Tax=Bacillus badius TaxID=1455 RepID=A0ABR5AQM5_BACBA|nr:hypothetical protein SD78_2938 [Bacillus badius]KIL77062.1 hypothetical protein SD77_1814 [Bacillus badius]
MIGIKAATLVESVRQHGDHSVFKKRRGCSKKSFFMTF